MNRGLSLIFYFLNKKNWKQMCKKWIYSFSGQKKNRFQYLRQVSCSVVEIFIFLFRKNQNTIYLPSHKMFESSETDWISRNQFSSQSKSMCNAKFHHWNLNGYFHCQITKSYWRNSITIGRSTLCGFYPS